MRNSKPSWACLASLFICFFPPAASSCRYTVRDVGFADIGSTAYHLYGYVRDDTPQPLVTAFRQISIAAFIDSNVEVEIVNVDQQESLPAIEYLQTWETDSFPATVLVSPDRRSLFIPIDRGDRSLQEAFWSAVDSVVSSPKREEILERIVKSYGIVLLIEGKRSDQNERAKSAAMRAIETIGEILDEMPKPVGDPPELAILPRESFGQEEILLWSLGVNEENSDEPSAAVLYGRGRRVGPLLEGEETINSHLLDILSVIGMDCQCGLDRDWILGDMIPLRWDSGMQSQVVKLLGFDAESPMIKREMSQIISLGSPSLASADASLGFFEGTLDSYIRPPIGAGGERPTARISPAQLQRMTSPEPRVPDRKSGFGTLWFVLAAMTVFVVSGGIGILLWSRWR